MLLLNSLAHILTSLSGASLLDRCELDVLLNFCVETFNFLWSKLLIQRAMNLQGVHKNWWLLYTIYFLCNTFFSLFVICMFGSCLSSKHVFNQRSSSGKICLLLNVFFDQRLSFIKGCHPLKVVFHQRLSSIKDHLQWKVAFHERSYSIKENFYSKVVFQQRPYFMEV